ncbi:DUF368 domain-containing protein [Kistimonas scapharcae]|uniref:DUF368 domain-containing protein n=2 Tax=Kistimonas scapharcae TaxID=1036133 RepID=A0ABP8V3R3_9GAMM
MGAADVVPGVSGGTVALITGIYAELLVSLGRLNPAALRLWYRQGFRAFWSQINGAFLLTLFAGILASVLSLAQLISYLLASHPIPVWSFFMGLILISAARLCQSLKKLSPTVVVLGMAGFAVAWELSAAGAISLPDPTLPVFFAAGAVAICAMILPGISGSAILLMLGLYAPVLAAVKSFDLPVLLVFCSGCALGLLAFSRLLAWLLERAQDLCMAFLTGLMLGSINRLWPWKLTLEWTIDSNGASVPVMQHNIAPWHFLELTGGDSQWAMALLMIGVGLLLVPMLERVGQRLADREVKSSAG